MLKTGPAITEASSQVISIWFGQRVFSVKISQVINSTRLNENSGQVSSCVTLYITGSQRGIWDKGSRAKKRVGSGITAPRSGITTPGIGISGVFHWIKDHAFWINKI